MSYSTRKAEEGRILPMPGVTVLTFPDGSQCVVAGLNEIFSDMYDRGTPVSLRTTRKIIKKVAVTRCINESFRQQYHHLLLEEYKKYYEARVCAERADDTAQSVPDNDLGLTRVLWKLLVTVFPSSHPWATIGQEETATGGK
jgi:hypothetical protein